MIQRNVNLRHLRAFSAVGQFGGVSAAADAVHLSQPAITQALSKLEGSLGAPLFVRQSRGMFLTEPGTLYKDRVDRALRFLDAGTDKAVKASETRRARGFQQFAQLLTNVQLRALLAVAETGNFSWAAKLVGVSQPSLHRAARDLERLSGIELFRRSSTGIELTPAAEELAQYARLAYAELRQGAEEINAWLGQDTAEIRIGTLPLARSRILPAVIEKLTRLQPDVRIGVIDGPYADLLHGLRHGQLDLMIGALREPAPVDDVVEEQLFRDALSVVGRKNHPLAACAKISVEALAEYPWVVPAPGIPTRKHFDSLFTSAGMEPPRRLVESSSLILIRGLLTRSDRLTILSARQVQDEIEQGLLQVLDVDLDDPPRSIGLTIRRDWRPTATQSLLIQRLREACASA